MPGLPSGRGRAAGAGLGAAARCAGSSLPRSRTRRTALCPRTRLQLAPHRAAAGDEAAAPRCELTHRQDLGQEKLAAALILTRDFCLLPVPEGGGQDSTHPQGDRSAQEPRKKRGDVSTGHSEPAHSSSTASLPAQAAAVTQETQYSRRMNKMQTVWCFRSLITLSTAAPYSPSPYCK